MTVDPPGELSWRVPSPAEVLSRRGIFQRAVLTGVAFTLALFVALKPAWWPLGFAVGAAAGGGMFWWQRWRFQSRFGNLPDNMRLTSAKFEWGPKDAPQGSIKKEDVTAFRLEQAEGFARAEALVLILQDGFESQPIVLLGDGLAADVRSLLRDSWHLEEQPSPRTCPVGTRSLRLPVYTEGHAERGEWHWEGSSVGLGSLAQALRSAAEEIPLPPPGARPKVLEVVGTRRDGSELLIAVDRQPWLDDLTIAAPPEQLRAVADSLEQALATVEDADFELELELPDDAAWSIHCHRRGE
jgi:hypothetical protein